MNYFTLANTYNITLHAPDLFLSLLYIALTILVIYIIAVLFRIYQSATITMKIFKNNQNSIGTILSNVDKISENAVSISDDVAHTMNVMMPTIDNVAETSEDITNTFKENNSINETIVTAYKTVKNANDFVSSIKNFGKNDED